MVNKNDKTAHLSIKEIISNHENIKLRLETHVCFSLRICDEILALLDVETFAALQFIGNIILYLITSRGGTDHWVLKTIINKDAINSHISWVDFNWGCNPFYLHP